MYNRTSNFRFNPAAPPTHLLARRALREGVRLALLLAAAGILALGFIWLPETATAQGELIIGELLAVAVGLELLVAAYFVEQPLAHSVKLNFLRARRDG